MGAQHIRMGEGASPLLRVVGDRLVIKFNCFSEGSRLVGELRNLHIFGRGLLLALSLLG